MVEFLLQSRLAIRLVGRLGKFGLGCLKLLLGGLVLCREGLVVLLELLQVGVEVLDQLCQMVQLEFGLLGLLGDLCLLLLGV